MAAEPPRRLLVALFACLLVFPEVPETINVVLPVECRDLGNSVPPADKCRATTIDLRSPGAARYVSAEGVVKRSPRLGRWLSAQP